MVLRKGAFPGYFFICNGPETGKLHVRQGSHHFIFFSSKKKQKLGDSMKLSHVTLPPDCLCSLVTGTYSM